MTKRCLTPRIEEKLKKLYGFSDDVEITEKCEESGQCLFYGGGYHRRREDPFLGIREGMIGENSI